MNKTVKEIKKQFKFFVVHFDYQKPLPIKPESTIIIFSNLKDLKAKIGQIPDFLFKIELDIDSIIKRLFVIFKQKKIKNLISDVCVTTLEVDSINKNFKLINKKLLFKLLPYILTVGYFIVLLPILTHLNNKQNKIKLENTSISNTPIDIIKEETQSEKPQKNLIKYASDPTDPNDDDDIFIKILKAFFRFLIALYMILKNQLKMTIKALRTIAVQVIVLNLIASFLKFGLDGYYSYKYGRSFFYDINVTDIPGK